MGSQQTIEPTNALVTIPANYPKTPAPGKLELLLNTNSTKLYREFSPYSDYNQNNLIGGFTTQPYFYTFI